MGRERGPSENLGKLSEAVGEWRAKGGGRGKRIPVELWDEAVRVARVEGVWRTAKATRFEYEGLKRRLAGAEGGEATTAADEIDSTEIENDEHQTRRWLASLSSSIPSISTNLITPFRSISNRHFQCHSVSEWHCGGTDAVEPMTGLMAGCSKPTTGIGTDLR